MKLFVGNLGYGVTEDSLRSLFASYGTVESVTILKDRDSGQSRGFGFVEMSNNNESQKAITALNGKEFEGRMLNVNEARPKEDRGFGGDRGGQRRRDRY